jgi:predicted HicB family RNase H-like nuclease
MEYFCGMVETDKIERRKPADSRKEAHLRVRVSEAHMEAFKAAAEKAGISLSAWVTERLLRVARQEQKAANKAT